MKKLSFFTLSFFLALSFFPSAYALTSTEGGFSIRMPGKAQLRHVDHKSAVGDVKENTYTLKSKSGEFNASFTELPDIAVSLQSDKALITRAKEGFIKDTGAQEMSFEDADCGGKKGKEMSFEISKENATQKGKARFCVSDKKLYVISATTQSTNLKGIDQYLNSFKLLNK